MRTQVLLISKQSALKLVSYVEAAVGLCCWPSCDFMYCLYHVKMLRLLSFMDMKV